MALHIPEKYRNNSLHVWCNKCKKTVTAKPCNHSDRQVYQSRIWNPITKQADILKTWEGTDVDQIFIDHLAFKKNITKKLKPRGGRGSMDLISAAKLYTDYLQDIGVPSHKKKNLSTQHIRDQVTYLKRFVKVLKSKKVNPRGTMIDQIDDDHVGYFHDYIESEGVGAWSYNAQMTAVKNWIKYIIKKQQLDFENPFDDFQRKAVAINSEIVTEEEFLALLSVINYENGWHFRNQKGKRTNYYRPWLADFYKASLLIGDRRSGMARLKWEHVKGNYIASPKFKENEHDNTDHFFSYTPITTDLAELLLRLSVSRRSDNDYLLVPDVENRKTLANTASRAFSHYWALTGINKKVTFNHLRKTYITRVISLLGDKASKIKHVENSEAIKHYLNEKEIIKPLSKQALFQIPI